MTTRLIKTPAQQRQADILGELLTRTQRIETKLTRMALAMDLDKTALPRTNAAYDLLADCLDFMEARLANEHDAAQFNQFAKAYDDLISVGVGNGY